MDDRIKTILNELRDSLRRIYGRRLVKLLLFGSHARGDSEPDSDIDVLVVLRGDVRPGKEIGQVGPITSALSLKYDTVLSCTFISDERYSREQSPLLLNVRREGIAV